MTPTSPSVAARPPLPFKPQQAPRAQYLDLRATVHRKLLNRLNLEALAQTDRSRAEAEIRTLLAQLLTGRSDAAQPRRARGALRGGARRRVRARAAGAAAARPDGQRHPGQHVQARLRRARRAPRARHRQLPGRPASDARDRSHRQRGRTARRRQLADGRRAPRGRIARQRDHSAAGGRRPRAVDPPVPGRTAEVGRPRDAAGADGADAGVPRALRPRAPQLPDQRRHRRRQDDAPQRAVRLHLRARAHRDDRGRRGAAAAPGARRAARDPAAERGRARAPSASASS